MPRKTTHGLLAKAFLRVPDLLELLPHHFGVKRQTIVSWARPKASDKDLYGTGKGNPLDRVEKLLDELHSFDPEITREIAEYFSVYVDELDRRAGFDEADTLEHPCRAIVRTIEAHSKLIKTSLGGCEDPRVVSSCLDSTVELKSRVIQLEACLRRVLQNGEEE